MYPEKAEQIITELLTTQLSSDLLYHNLDHTRSVVHSSMELAGMEGVSNSEELFLLLTAAWFHDCGYVNTYESHEEESCRIAMKLLPDAGYTKEQLDIICSMIMKTHVPQQPVTKLEMILCDADLDYLGKNDFSRLGNSLFREWMIKGRVKDENEFNKIQIHFLEGHRYWTSTAQMLRQPVKEKHLQHLKMLCEQ
jgi:uncharacterized protein